MVHLALTSTVTIQVSAKWTALSCTASSAVLGSAGAVGIWRDFSGAPVAGHWYPNALANKLHGTDLDPAAVDINANFNVNLGQPGCLTGIFFYLGLDNNHGSSIDLSTVLLHELGHGLGFATFTSGSTGSFNGGFPSIWDDFLLDNTTGKTWTQMTAAERVVSALNTGHLVWNGANVAFSVPQVLQASGGSFTGADSLGRARMYAPSSLQSGSSVSHYDTVMTPNQIMEPAINSNLVHEVTPPGDLTYPLLNDIGWNVGTSSVPTLSVNNAHTGNFIQGQVGATYNILVSNTGNLATSGTVSVADALPTGLTATAISGTGWTCTLATLICSRANALVPGGSYPVITVTVNVAGGATGPVTNQTDAWGGGSIPAHSDDVTNILWPTTTSIGTISPEPSAVGQVYSVAYTVTSAGGTPIGNVTVTDGSASNTCTVAAAACSLISTGAGAKTITATYAGNSSFSGSFGTKSCTVYGAQPISVTPASGSSGRQLFSFISRNTLGANSIKYTQFLFSKSGLSALNACYISYDPTANVFYLLSDDMTQWYGLLGGSVNNIGNAQCTIYGATSGSAKVGTDLTTNVDVSFRSGFGGSKSIHQFSEDILGNGSSWILMGTWNDTGDPSAVELVSLTPNSGTGVSQVFTTVTKDGDGATTIPFVQFVMNNGLSGFNGCFIHYDRASNVFFLLNDAGTAFSGMFAGSGQVSNSQCTLHGAGSGGTVLGSNLTVTYVLEFSAGFTGTKKVFMQALDNTNCIQVWRQMGTWTQ